MGDCIACHTDMKGGTPAFAGGLPLATPFGTFYSPNITPDKETGIGNYTDAEIARVLRYGVHPNGTAVFDFMPFHNTSDEDLTAIISYLRTQKPVRHEIPDHELNPVGKAVKAFMVKPVGPDGEVPKTVVPDTTAAYGKYITISVAECNGCHTKRNLAGAFEGEPFAGGNDIEGFITPNLTPDSSGRIFNWTKEMFIERFRMGKLIPKSPMPWNSFKRMTDEELTAIYNYLKTVKPVNTAVVKDK